MLTSTEVRAAFRIGKVALRNHVVSGRLSPHRERGRGGRERWLFRPMDCERVLGTPTFDLTRSA